MPSTAKLIASSVTPGTPSTGSNVPMFGSVVGRLGVGGGVGRRVGRRVGVCASCLRWCRPWCRPASCRRWSPPWCGGRGVTSRRRSSCRTRRGSARRRRRPRAGVLTRIVGVENCSRWAPLVEADSPAAPVQCRRTLLSSTESANSHSAQRDAVVRHRTRSSSVASSSRDAPSTGRTRCPGTVASGRHRATTHPPKPPPVIRAPNTPGWSSSSRTARSMVGVETAKSSLRLRWLGDHQVARAGVVARAECRRRMR